MSRWRQAAPSRSGRQRCRGCFLSAPTRSPATGGSEGDTVRWCDESLNPTGHRKWSPGPSPPGRRRRAAGPATGSRPPLRRGRSRSACVVNGRLRHTGKDPVQPAPPLCRIPCLILCLAYVERVGQCRAPNAPCRLHRQGLISRTPHTLDCHRDHLPPPQWIKEGKQAAHWTRFLTVEVGTDQCQLFSFFGLRTISSVF